MVGNLRVRKITAEKQFSKEMKVERLSVNTGETKEASSDLLTEVRNVITDQTKTISESLARIENINQIQLNALRRGIMGSSSSGKSVADTLVTELGRGLNKSIKEAFAGLNIGGPGGTGGSGRPPAGGSGTGSAGSAGGSELANTMNELKGLFKALAVREGIVGGEGGGSTSGRGFGEVSILPKLFASVEEISKQFINGSDNFRTLTKYVKDTNSNFEKLVGSGVIQQLEANVRDVAQTIQNFGRDLVSIRKITQFWTGRFSSSMDIAATGVADFDTALLDFFPGFIRGGDQLTATFKLIRSSMEGDVINPLGRLGMNLDEVSQTMMDARRGFRADGITAIQRMTWQDSNEAIINLFALEMRRDVFADLDRSQTRENIAKQLDFAQMIASNTGLTATEVIKLNKENAENMRSLEAGGILRGDQRQGFEDAIQVFAREPHMKVIAEMIAGVARAGGNIGLFRAENSDMSQNLAVLDKAGVLDELINVVNSGLTGDDFSNALMRVARKFSQNITFAGGGRSLVLDESGRKLAVSGNYAREYLERPEVDIFTRNLTNLWDIVANWIPSAEVGMITALIANTVALWSNTASRAMGGILGMGGAGIASGVPGGVAGASGGMGLAKAIRGRGGAGLMGKMGAAGAGIAGGAMGMGKGALRLGKVGLKTLIKKIPIIGALAALGFGASRAFAGDFTGAGMEVASGAASIVPGLGTAASFGIDGALAARDAGVFDSSGPSVGPTTRSTTDRSHGDTARLLRMNNSIMERVLTELVQQTKLSQDIRRNTNPVRPDQGLWAGLFGSEEAKSAG